MADKIHSTGRGGAGNIGEDPIQYVEGGIVREGVVGEGRPDYSSGRGGAGNMNHSPRDSPRNSPALNAQRGGITSEDIIPETNMRSSEGYENFHTGRGGQGNVHKDKYGGHSNAQKEVGAEGKPGFLEKAKEKLGLDHHKEKKESPLSKETGPA